MSNHIQPPEAAKANDKYTNKDICLPKTQRPTFGVSETQFWLAVRSTRMPLSL